VESVIQDIRFAARTFVRNPTFTLVAVITLGLGIGAGTAIFSAVDGVLLRPLPYDNPSELVFLGTTFDDSRPGWTSVPDFIDWKNRLTSIRSLTASQLDALTLLEGEEPERLPMARVSPDFFSALRIHPSPGRVFSDGEHRTGAEPVAILSHSLWERRWGGDRSVVGDVVTTSQGPLRVVGVMPTGFEPPVAMWLQNIDIWLPLEVDAAAYAEARGARSLRVIGRLRPEFSLEAARQEVTSLARAMAVEYPEAYRWGDGTLGIGISPLLEMTVGDTRSDLVMLLASTGLLLLIGCANVANLLLARATNRGKEIALRTSLGAGRGRMIRQLLTESIILAGLGGCVGVGLAFAGVRVFQIFGPRDFPRFAEVQISPGVLAFACGVALLTGLLFGLAPALFSAPKDLSASLKEGGNLTPRRSRARLRPLLVVAETALALVLLCGAGILINSTVRLQNVDPGFSPENLLMTEIGLRSSYTSNEQRAAFFRELLDRARVVPGVESAAAIADPPMGPAMWLPTVFTEGSESEEPPPVAAHLVAGEFFETMGIRLLAGRTFTLRDDAGHPSVAIVNETMARRYWPSEDPVGRRIRLSRDPRARWYTVVGVVDDIRHVHLSSPPEPELYVTYSQNAWFGWMSLVVRTRSGPETVSGPLRRAIWTIDPTVPFEDFSLMDERLSALLSAPRFRTLILTGFAVIALVLAVAGVYGALLCTVGQRRYEVGVRMALGAQPSDISRIILGQGLVMVFAGMTAGIVGFAVLSKLLEGFVFGVTVTDPATLALVTVLLSATALVACSMPARKAARVDPMVTLRSE
jgi:putative ABC transport system permease protein